VPGVPGPRGFGEALGKRTHVPARSWIHGGTAARTAALAGGVLPEGGGGGGDSGAGGAAQDADVAGSDSQSPSPRAAPIIDRIVRVLVLGELVVEALSGAVPAVRGERPSGVGAGLRP